MKAVLDHIHDVILDGELSGMLRWMLFFGVAALVLLLGVILEFGGFEIRPPPLDGYGPVRIALFVLLTAITVFVITPFAIIVVFALMMFMRAAMSGDVSPRHLL